MKYFKYALFLISFVLNILFIFRGIELINKQNALAKNKNELVSVSVEDHNEYKNYEEQIVHMEMLVATFTFINIFIVLIFLFSNHQDLMDRWRKFRNIESEKPYDLS